MSEQTHYLDSLQTPRDIHRLPEEALPHLAEEIRHKLIETVSETGGHLASNLGIVETTIALHRVFDLPHDQIVFDVGHQCYVHKLLTGRARDFGTLRQKDGLSGFPSPKESDCDAFIVGHSSTAVSAANGLAKAKSLLGDDGYVVAVVGDGAITGGLFYEGMENAGRSHDKLIVVLNDNRMSINSNVGFVARHLVRLRSRPKYLRFKRTVNKILEKIPLVGKPMTRFLAAVKLGIKGAIYHDSSLFEDMGFYYLGPVNGHNITELETVLRAAKTVDQPVIVHVDTVKGQGYRYSTERPEAYHGVGAFDIETGQFLENGESFSSVFGETAKELCGADERICLITAAMKDGTGLGGAFEQWPKRCFDVGIAEEHAVTFASGLAHNGMIPIFAVYATFLQRAFDQLLNDTSIINSHIVLAVDRAGVVPGDGETHQGVFDVPMLNAIPNATVYAPSCYAELRIHLKQAVYDVEGIAAVRYPKGDESMIPSGYEPDYRPFTWYRARRSEILLITYGRLFGTVMKAAEELKKRGRSVSVLKINRIKPIDPACLQVALEYYRVYFFEEGSLHGGVGEAFGHLLSSRDFARHYEVHAIDRWIPCCTTEEGLHMVGLDVEGILSAVERGGTVFPAADNGSAVRPSEEPNGVEEPLPPDDDRRDESAAEQAGSPAEEAP